MIQFGFWSVVMCPVSTRCFLCWCVLSGHLLITVLSVSLEQYITQPADSGKGLYPHFGPVSSNRSDERYALSFLEPRYSALTIDYVSCEDLEGDGTFNTTCLLNSDLFVNSNIYVFGTGNLEILPHVSIVCPIEGCIIHFNLSGNVKVGHNAAIIAGSVVFAAANLTMGSDSSINTTALAGPPPSQTSGTPVGNDGAGGGHGGRGASCLKSNDTSFWGGDVYCWSSLSDPWCYGSKGGGTSVQHKFGGKGGGRILLDVKDVLFLNGSVTAEGGDGGLTGGGGSGGSITIRAKKL